MKLKMAGRFNREEDLLVAVVCSTDPLPVSLAIANGIPVNFAIKMETEGNRYSIPYDEPDISKSFIPRSKILFLRQNKNCGFLKNKWVGVNYWIVPKRNELPSFVEARTSSDFSEYVLTDFYDVFYNSPEDKVYRAIFKPGEEEKQIKLTPEIYKTALNKLVDSLKQNRTAIAVIQIPYSGKSPNKKILSNVLLTQTFLKKNGIGSHRIFVKRIHFEDYGSPNDDSTSKYPNITIVFQDGITITL